MKSCTSVRGEHVSDMAVWAPYRPLSKDELLSRFERDDSSSKHLLILYSLVIGLQAKTVIDFGLGQTTGALRAAILKTRGTVYTCDFDRRRFEPILSEQDEHWSLFLESSSSFLKKIPGPIDLVMHDGAHDYLTVRRDLEALIPKMRKFGIICVHDTQQSDLSGDMLQALRDATRNSSVSVVNLPFSAGLAIIRVESSTHDSIVPSTGLLPDGRRETTPAEFLINSTCEGQVSHIRGRFTAAKLKLGHILRQAGLRQ